MTSGKPLLADHPRFYRRPARRHLVDPAYVHLAILSSVSVRGIGVAVITSRCGGFSALDDEQQALRHAEAMLLVDHGKAQLLIGDLLLENGVSADEHVDRAIGKPHQHAISRACPFRVR